MPATSKTSSTLLTPLYRSNKLDLRYSLHFTAVVDPTIDQLEFLHPH